MSISLAATDLLKTLDPSTAALRATYSNRRRPWVAGYGIKTTSIGTTLMYGVNYPGTLAPVTKKISLAGAGAAGGAGVYTYTVPANTVTLPTDTSVAEANTYLNAIMVAYTNGNPFGTLIPRLGKDVANLSAGPFWRVETASTIETVGGGTTGAFTDWATTQTIELIVPTTADIVLLIDNVTGQEEVCNAMDFLAAGGSGKTGVLYLNRIMQ